MCISYYRIWSIKNSGRARDARARHVRRLVLNFDEVGWVVASLSEHEPMSRVRLYFAESTAMLSAPSRASCGSSNDARRACRLESSVRSWRHQRLFSGPWFLGAVACDFFGPPLPFFWLP